MTKIRLVGSLGAKKVMFDDEEIGKVARLVENSLPERKVVANICRETEKFQILECNHIAQVTTDIFPATRFCETCGPVQKDNGTE